MTGIQVNGDVFGRMNPADPYSSADEFVAVVTRSRDEAIEAMAKTTQRWMLIRLDGHEYATLDELIGSTSDLPTPSWVSDVEEFQDELRLGIDASGHIPAPMRRRLVEALTTQLTRAGVQHARVRRPTRGVTGGVVVAKARPPD